MITRIQTVSLILVAAIVVFLIPIVWGYFTHDFPANDGGLFTVFARDIQNAQFRLPTFTAYNNDRIPFTYPPFSFYILALGNAVTAVDIIELQRGIPVLLALTNVFIFFLFARTLFPQRYYALLMTLCYSANAHTYHWLLVGAGISRAFGLCFALTALWLQQRLFSTGAWRYRAGMALAVAGTFASHPEWTVFLVISMVFFALREAPRKKRILETFISFGVALMLVSPWWITVLRNHGLGAFLSPASAGYHTLYWEYLRAFDILRFDQRDPLLLAGIVGILLSALGKPKFIAVWFAVLTLSNIRSSLAFTVPALTLASGLTLINAVDYARKQHSRRILYAILLLAGAGTLYLNIRYDVYRESFLHPFDREALTWVSRNTPTDARFLVAYDHTEFDWPFDALREWFFTLSGRTSIATVQGYEWKAHEFSRRIMLNGTLAACFNQTLECYETWARTYDQTFTHIYLVALHKNTGNPCCERLIQELNASPAYTQIYSEHDRMIWELNTPGTPRPSQ